MSQPAKYPGASPKEIKIAEDLVELTEKGALTWRMEEDGKLKAAAGASAFVLANEEGQNPSLVVTKGTQKLRMIGGVDPMLGLRSPSHKQLGELMQRLWESACKSSEETVDGDLDGVAGELAQLRKERGI